MRKLFVWVIAIAATLVSPSQRAANAEPETECPEHATYVGLRTGYLCDLWRTRPATERDVYEVKWIHRPENHFGSCEEWVEAARNKKVGYLLAANTSSDLTWHKTLHPKATVDETPFLKVSGFTFWKGHVEIPTPDNSWIEMYVPVWTGQTLVEWTKLHEYYLKAVEPHERGHEYIRDWILDALSEKTYVIQAPTRSAAAHKIELHVYLEASRVHKFAQQSYDRFVDYGNVLYMPDEMVRAREDLLLYFCDKPPPICRATLRQASECVVPKRLQALAWGDPHLTTFDGAKYDLQSVGEFTYLDSESLTVQARHEPYISPSGAKSNSVSVIRAVAVRLLQSRVTFQIGSDGFKMRIDGTVTPLMVGDSATLGPGATIRAEPIRRAQGVPVIGKRFVFSWGDDARSLFVDVFPRNISIYATMVDGDLVAGLLGTPNGSRSDDVTLADGTTPVQITQSWISGELANAWRLTAGTSLFDYAAGQSTSTFESPAFPTEELSLATLNVAAKAAATEKCELAGISLEPLLSACILDVAATGSNEFATAGSVAMGALTTRLIEVPSQSNLWGAGLDVVPDFGEEGNGALPVKLGLPNESDGVLSVVMASGTLSLGNGIVGVQPDGLANPAASPPVLFSAPETHLSAVTSRRRLFLAAVFLDEANQTTGTPAAFACGDMTASTYTPELGQIFCLGDGRDGLGDAQSFTIPDGATTVYFGYLSRQDSQSPPGWYQDDLDSWWIAVDA